MSSITKTVAATIVSGLVAIGGFAVFNDPGDPEPFCETKIMRPGDTCVVTTRARQDIRTYERQVEALRSTRRNRGLVAGVAGAIAFAGAAGYLTLLIGARREKTREAARPHLGLRRKLAEENGWRFAADDPSIAQVFPAAARKGRTEHRFTEVVRGDLDGVRFEAFDHGYQVYDKKKGVLDAQDTVLLFHHPGLMLNDVSVFTDQVFPYAAANLILTRRLQDAMRHHAITHFTLYQGTVVVTRPLFRDHTTAELHDLLRATRALLNEFPTTALDRTRT
ncbi:hypothetical protein [Actinoplanes derwentensis]|uniref:Uncharacterized protein n=1 Tax=Actinoplanes derwentensis TaxID=113562 RepID=A0A1H1RSP2_9ACTN|nr:hypothetical protein [Actinoplanes derwentensis]GID84507.1 hypothetical protein Ade03nite_34310 [Actinoplanes derwentensis]SDS38566.1 hypothetical protein SAMN04489716_0673 [Actinoplanes derwentensis]